MRLVLTDDEFKCVISSLLSIKKSTKERNKKNLQQEIILKLLKQREQNKLTALKKQNATSKATATRVARTKKKIENAINLLRIENAEITKEKIREYSGTSFQSIEKYTNF